MSNYHHDRRVLASSLPSIFQNFDESDMTAEFEDEDEETLHTVHLQYEVCDTCTGRGKVVNPSIDCDGLTARDFEDDPDFAVAYRSGQYDIPCPCCHGMRVMLVLDTVATSADVVQMVEEREAADMRFARMCADERRMGA